MIQKISSEILINYPYLKILQVQKIYIMFVGKMDLIIEKVIKNFNKAFGT